MKISWARPNPNQKRLTSAGGRRREPFLGLRPTTRDHKQRASLKPYALLDGRRYVTGQIAKTQPSEVVYAIAQSRNVAYNEP